MLDPDKRHIIKFYRALQDLHCFILYTCANVAYCLAQLEGGIHVSWLETYLEVKSKTVEIFKVS